MNYIQHKNSIHVFTCNFNKSHILFFAVIVLLLLNWAIGIIILASFSWSMGFIIYIINGFLIGTHRIFLGFALDDFLPYLFCKLVDVLLVLICPFMAGSGYV